LKYQINSDDFVIQLQISQTHCTRTIWFWIWSYSNDAPYHV